MVNPVSELTVQALKEYDTATVSNAIEAFNVRDRTEGYASGSLACQYPDLPPMVGFAITCTADSTTQVPKRKNNRHALFDAIAAAPKPVVVIIQNVGPNVERSCFLGDMVAAASQQLGAVGVVTDGGVRDRSGIRQRAPGFQLFSTGVVASRGSSTYLDVNVPVSICGLEIEPGDLLHGDESGLVKIPLDIAAEVSVQSGEIIEQETKLFDLLASGNATLDTIKDHLKG